MTHINTDLANAFNAALFTESPNVVDTIAAIGVYHSILTFLADIY
jgi:hypothetical protein